MARPSQQVRIIGGKWRGRKISFPAVDELRPTHDRIRETLFNWLMPYINDAVCLDLFAGSGAIGFEALSRGAKKVVMLDNNREVVSSLKESAEILNADNCEILYGEFPNRLPSFEREQFDIVFIDPPFNKNLIASVCEWINSTGILKSDALVYLEAEKELDPLPIPSHWKIIKEGKTATIKYCLVCVSSSLHRTVVARSQAEGEDDEAIQKI